MTDAHRQGIHEGGELSREATAEGSSAVQSEAGRKAKSLTRAHLGSVVEPARREGGVDLVWRRPPACLQRAFRPVAARVMAGVTTR